MILSLDILISFMLKKDCATLSTPIVDVRALWCSFGGPGGDLGDLSLNIRHNLVQFTSGVLMQIRTASMSAMLAITKHGVCACVIAPCLAIS